MENVNLLHICKHEMVAEGYTDKAITVFHSKMQSYFYVVKKKITRHALHTFSVLLTNTVHRSMWFGGSVLNTGPFLLWALRTRLRGENERTSGWNVVTDDLRTEDHNLFFFTFKFSMNTNSPLHFYIIKQLYVYRYKFI